MKLICGPMATISHPAFRILVEKFGGCDEYFTEMINAGTLIKNGPFEKYYIDPTPVPEKVVWQLTGRNEEQMVEASKVLLPLKGIGVDLNMGCSAPDIYRYGAGISWMIKPENETFSMVEKVYKNFREYNKRVEEGSVDSSNEDILNKKRFSIKLRLGDDDFTDEKFFNFCDKLSDLGVELLTLHPRTKKEKLARPARYEYCQQLAEKMHKKGVLVYLNGNVKDIASYQNAVLRAPSVDGVMISRASVQKPWIFRELKREIALSEGTSQICEPLEVDLLELSLDYIANIEKYQPQEFWKTRLQRFFGYFSQNFLFAHYAQTEFLNATDNEDLKNRLIAFFQKCPEERYKKFE